jgi:hypothetical protein
MGDVIHVLPTDDLREHEINKKCWCYPEIKEGGLLVVHNSLEGGLFVVHNSLEGRELSEPDYQGVKTTEGDLEYVFIKHVETI